MSNVREPKSVSDALTNQEWFDAMKAEINSLHDYSIWEGTCTVSRRPKAYREQVGL